MISLEEAQKAKKILEHLLSKRSCPNIVGIGVGRQRLDHIIVISLKEDGWFGFPKSIDGVPVVVKVVGEIKSVVNS